MTGHGHRRRRRASPVARLSSVLAWILLAAVIAAVVLIATGRSAVIAVGIAAACAAVAALVIVALDLTGILRVTSPDASGTSDDPPVGSSP